MSYYIELYFRQKTAQVTQ